LRVNDPNEVAKAGAWLSWAVPLLLTEPILQLRKFRRPAQVAVPNVASDSA
jgi:hypothetical protein